MNEKIAVVGLGYVGLPVAVALGRKVDVIGFDIDKGRIEELNAGHDRTNEVDAEGLADTRVTYSADAACLAEATTYIVTVPTPIDGNRQPDLSPVISASRSVGKALKAGDLVIFESTVYPGVTEDICGPLLAETSGLDRDQFSLGYSPERINPGDKVHRLETIVKVVSGDSPASLERVAQIYELVVTAGVHRAPSIRVAEAAKVIENTQRDVNIALMNELALIFDRMDLRTADVLAASGTKWNFLRFTPGLVGGHCIGVDPYYLTAKAESLGYHPQVILSGRRINDGMGAFIAQKLIKLLIAAELPVKGAKVAVVGLTFKEDVPDLRNSRVPDIVEELQAFGITPQVHDPVAKPEVAVHEYGITLSDLGGPGEYDAIIFAVPHAVIDPAALMPLVRDGGILIDVKSKLNPSDVPSNLTYWSL